MSSDIQAAEEVWIYGYVPVAFMWVSCAVSSLIGVGIMDNISRYGFDTYHIYWWKCINIYIIYRDFVIPFIP